MPVEVNGIKVGKHYSAGRQIREVVEIAIKVVERTPPKNKSGMRTADTIKTRKKRVRYKSRGHKASMKYGPMIWVDIDKFARDVDKAVAAHYDPDYEN